MQVEFCYWSCLGIKLILSLSLYHTLLDLSLECATIGSELNITRVMLLILKGNLEIVCLIHSGFE